jgi:hypothetical protein
MKSFTNYKISSSREKWLWIWLFFVLIAIFISIVFSSTIPEVLGYGELFGGLFFFGFLILFAAIGLQGLRVKIGKVEIGILIGVVAVYAMLVSRLGITERTHLFEYSLVAALIYQIILERQKNGLTIKFPAVRAVAIGTTIGLFDEIIQLFFPDRYFDIIDVGFNALASFMAVVTIIVLNWGRIFFVKLRSR